MKTEENVLLSTLTTFKTGGPARFLISAGNEEDIRSAAAFAKERGLPLIPLGGGSNMCAPDEGVEAVFVRFLPHEVSVEKQEDDVIVSADAGLSWDALVAYTCENGWWGLENLSGIPGTVGASAVQNIGAYGAAAEQHIVSVSALDLVTGAMREFANDECAFGYRMSVFKKEADRFFITRVSFRLSVTPQPDLSYRDLSNRFEGKETPSLRDVRDAVIEIRKGKFPPLERFGTAGSFFLNPVVSPEEAESMRERFPGMPLFDMPEGGVKAPLAWLFDRVLSLKGMREGGAFVWEKQPLVLAAEPGARSADVYALAEKITALAREKTGIAIAPEVRLFR